MIDTIPAFICLKDKKNNYIRVNKYMADFCGTTADKMINTNMEQWYTKEQSDKFYRDDLVVLDRGIKHSYLENITNRKGKTLTVRTIKVPYKNKEGEVIGILVIAVEVSGVEQKLE